ncbi:dTDP-glucose 4,6-dehydratase [Candidatus Peregrinibacteria bacterium]|nr:dTDP-glucose 4,6-dehydratase [Candidatus Peregrinibacteria bacterium]
MNLLVTGGAGFIGSNFILHVLKKYPKYTIVNFDKLTYAGNTKNLSGTDKNLNYFFIQGDIADAKLVKKIIQKYSLTHIVNFAAETHVDRSITDPDAFIQTNVVGTHSLLKCALEARVKRFLHISTDEVYGALGKTGSFTEKIPLSPRSPYAASKAAGDHLVFSYFHTYKLPALITRSSNNYGPRQYPEKLIPLFIKNLLANKKVPLYATGGNIRDWLYVLDNCEALDLVLHTGRLGEVYNIGGECEKTNKEVAMMILAELGKSASFIQYVADRPGHDFRYSLNTKKIQSELGWKPKMPFKRGIHETVEWYKQLS